MLGSLQMIEIDSHLLFVCVEIHESYLLNITTKDSMVSVLGPKKVSANKGVNYFYL